MQEATIGCGCGCGGSTCGTMPSEFVRVRYYFGQRLGVLELSDQALYHGGKLAFHNARLHGAGVLCGLRAERVPPPAGTGTRSTVLRVTAGAALDPCGREIVVGIDQCVDVAAWFARNQARPELEDWTANTTHALRVAVRYRECPSDPSPAPRDPCGCDNGGCEFGRVREGFELGLFTEEEDVCAAPAFPDPAALGDALGTPPPTIGELVAAGCPGATGDEWLCLATFDVTLDATPVPVDISEPDNGIPERRTLLSTSALQAVLGALYEEGVASGELGGGPRAGALRFIADATNPATAGELRLEIALADAGNPPLPSPLVANTFEPSFIKVAALDPANDWADVTPSGSGAIAYDASSTPPAVRIAFAQDLAAGQVFRLTLDAPFATPVADTAGRPLPRVARQFAFVLNSSGALELAPSA
jgi:hypothetical protein